MPEMPEVQAHAERMTAALAGRRLAKFELLNTKILSLQTIDLGKGLSQDEGSSDWAEEMEKVKPL